MLRLLISLGIRVVDAEVYLYLATTQPKKGRELYDKLKMDKHKLYRSLRRLKKKGLVKASPEHPSIFTAITLEHSLDSFRDSKVEEVEFIKEKKDELLSRWKTIIEKNQQKKDLK